MLRNVTRRRLKLASRGIEIALLEWGREGPLALLHHANGFCAATWALVAEHLYPRYRVVAIDARGHGDSTQLEGVEAYDWRHFVDDLIAVAEALATGPEGVSLGSGSSFGGTVTACAAALRPDLFGRVAMLDPVILPTPELLARRGGAPHPSWNGDVPSSERARQRRQVFASREVARASWATKPLFAAWDPRALELYAQEGMRERADGRVELKCPAEAEASIFEMNTSLDPFSIAERVSAPTLIVRAGRGGFPRVVYEELARCMPRARVVEHDAGHLLPMEDPTGTARLLLEFGEGAA